VFVWGRVTDTTTQVTNGNPGSGFTAICWDGRFISYTSFAPDYGTSHAVNVFVWDRATDTTTQITNGNAFSGNPAISGRPLVQLPLLRVKPGVG
jgi:hypothetical protein